MNERSTWLLRRSPALDGVRALAVLLVLTSHLALTSGPIRSLGPLGVTIFFTLSGFLITTLLLDEHQGSGRVDLRRFYRRRVLRLAPALLATVAAVVLAGVFLGHRYIGWPLVVGALTYSSNWIEAAGVAPGSALGHTWSLAIEEQFYVVWPLVLIWLLRRGRHALVVVSVVGIVLSTCLRFVLWSDGWERVYYGSDTRADALLVGCLLAVVMQNRGSGANRPHVAVLSMVGIVLMTFASLPFTFLAAPLAVATLSAIAIHSVVREGHVPWLSHPAAVWVGRRSYGLYLWHYPVVIGLLTVAPGAALAIRVLVIVPLSFLLTLLSWRYIETPFLQRREGPSDAPLVQSPQVNVA